MRIAQVAPLYESCPPQFYGGTERVVSYLTEELVRLGHEVTLFASGDSITRARLQASCKRALRLDQPDLGPIYSEYPEVPLVSISDAQRIHLPQLNWATTIHHGLPLDLYSC